MEYSSWKKVTLVAFGLMISAPTLWATESVSMTEASTEFYYTVGEKRIHLDKVENQMSVGVLPGKSLPKNINLSTPAGPVTGKSSQINGSVWRVLIDPIPPISREARLDSNVAMDSMAANSRKDKHTKRTQLRTRYSGALESLAEDDAVAWSYPAYRSRETGTLLWLTPRIIAGLDSSVDVSTLDSRLAGVLRYVRSLKQPNQVLLEMVNPRTDNPLVVAQQLANEYSWVRWAEPDFIQNWQHTAVPNDPLFPNQWHLQNTGQGGGVPGADARLSGAWDLETGDPSIVIAVIDDGVELLHPDLPIFNNPGEIPGNFIDDDGNGYVDDVTGWDFMQGDNVPNPDLTGPGSHGTAVAGVAAAKGNNSLGVSGACQNCSILPVRVANAASFATDAILADALTYGSENANLLNNSWGGGSPSAAIDTAIVGSVANGVTPFFANGNSASGYITLSVTGFVAGTYTFEWTYAKDESVAAGLDTAFLDNVLFPDGNLETFEGCTGLPIGWTSGGNASWVPVNDDTRSSSSIGGNCAIQAGLISDDQFTSVTVTKTLATGGDLVYQLWPSSEVDYTLDGEGPIAQDSCYDSIYLTVYDAFGGVFGPFYNLCGTFSNQGNPLQDGVISYPSSHPQAVSVGAATNHDRRSDYSQWGTGNDFVCHSNGGSLGISTTDVQGANGYDVTDYTSTFGGTSSATPLCTGIAALALSRNPALTPNDIRQLMQNNTRQIGPYLYDPQGWNAVYGHGAVDAAGVVLNAISTCPATLDLYDQVLIGGVWRASTHINLGPNLSISGTPSETAEYISQTIGFNGPVGVNGPASFHTVAVPCL